MKRIWLIAACIVGVILFICPTLSSAEELKPIELPDPQMVGGRPLMEVLKDRQSNREYIDKKLPIQVFSNLLWAAMGINRPESGKRTAPMYVRPARIFLYVATADGLYLYDAEGHMLKPILAKDIRSFTGRQQFVETAAVNLIYVANLSVGGPGGYIRTETDKFEEHMLLVNSATAGCIGQNVYLYCASEGLATVLRGMVDKQDLAKAMKLRPDQKVLLAQSVGYLKE